MTPPTSDPGKTDVTVDPGKTAATVEIPIHIIEAATGGSLDGSYGGSTGGLNGVSEGNAPTDADYGNGLVEVSSNMSGGASDTDGYGLKPGDPSISILVYLTSTGEGPYWIKFVSQSETDVAEDIHLSIDPRGGRTDLALEERRSGNNTVHGSTDSIGWSASTRYFIEVDWAEDGTWTIDVTDGNDGYIDGFSAHWDRWTHEANGWRNNGNADAYFDSLVVQKELPSRPLSRSTLSPLNKPRDSVYGCWHTGTDELFAVGGYDQNTSSLISSVEALTPNSGWKTTYADIPTARRYHALVSDGSRVWAIAGGDNGSALSSVESLDPGNGWTTTHTDLTNAQRRACIAFDGSEWVYLFYGNSRTRLAQRYSIVDETTEQLAAPPTPAVDNGAAYYDPDNEVVGILGGYDGGSRITRHLTYKIQSGSYSTSRADIQVARSHTRAVRTGDWVYHLMGWDGSDSYSCVYRYSIPSDDWQFVNSAYYGRRSMATAVDETDQSIIAAGGGGYNHDNDLAETLRLS